MEKIDFWSPRYLGERFVNHTLPIDTLKDLIALEQLIVELAKHKFRESHGRSRVPRNFTSGVSIDISGVDEGSAKPVISLLIASNILFAPIVDIYKEVQASIIDGISQANRGDSVTAIPKEFLQAFDKIGRSLKHDEGIEFCPQCNDGNRAWYNQQTRKTLLSQSSEPSILSKKIELKGKVSAFDSEKKRYSFSALNMPRVESILLPDISESVLNALVASFHGAYVLLDGVGRFKDGQLSEITEINSINELDSMDTSVRLYSFLELKDGWLDGKGSAPSHVSIAKIVSFFDHVLLKNVPPPYLFPTAEGGVFAEWKKGACDISFEVDKDARSGVFHSLNLDTDAEVEKKISLSADEIHLLVESLSGIEGEYA